MGKGILGNLGAAYESIQVRHRVMVHSSTANTERELKPEQLLEIRVLNRDILAYLWMAIDAKLNLLIVGNEYTGKRQLMFSLSHLIPNSEKVLVYGDGTEMLQYRNNFVHFVSGKADTESALSNNAERILINVSTPGAARMLLDCANHGIPFMATMNLASNEKDILERLEAKPTRIPKHNINMLDLCIMMGHGESSIWKLQSIMEYSWLSRTEYFLDDAKSAPDFQFKATSIVNNGALETEALKSSKVFRAFGDYNIMSRKEVMEEFERRATQIPGLPKRL